MTLFHQLRNFNMQVKINKELKVAINMWKIKKIQIKQN
jgi:hypothetical protein